MASSPSCSKRPTEIFPPIHVNAPTQTPEVESWLEIVRQKAETVRYGSVQIIIHDGRVTQVESTEKTRLPNEASTGRS